MNTPFPVDPVQTAIAIAYTNPKLIADSVMPRVPVGRELFKYKEHTLAESFTVPDTKVGRKSKTNQVSFTSKDKTDSTEDFGLEDPIPFSDIEQAPEGFDPLDHSTEYLTGLIGLGREIRTAGIIFDPATYGANNKKTLSGTGQWSDSASDPLLEILHALDKCIMRPNKMTIGRKAYTALATHPIIVKATNGNSGDSGMASRQAIAELLELDEINVGEGFVNLARKGQPVNMQRVWGNHVALTYIDATARPNSGTTFAFTAEYGTRISGAMFDKDIGAKGGQMNRVVESLKEVVAAPDLGFFLQDVIAA
jgi:hypothetical protein